jgi:threonine synthase
VLDEFFSSGGYHPRGLDRTFETSSPSMDITKASNLERFVFDLLGRDADTLADLWSGIDAGKGFQLSKENFSKMHDVYGFRSSRSTHDDRLSNIRSVFANYGREIDPHTADGFKAALEHRDANIAMVILETALPAKFEDTMVEAIGQKPQRPAALVDLEDLPQRFDVLEADVAALKAYLVERIKE